MPSMPSTSAARLSHGVAGKQHDRDQAGQEQVPCQQVAQDRLAQSHRRAIGAGHAQAPRLERERLAAMGPAIDEVHDRRRRRRQPAGSSAALGQRVGPPRRGDQHIARSENHAEQQGGFVDQRREPQTQPHRCHRPAGRSVRACPHQLLLGRLRFAGGTGLALRCVLGGLFRFLCGLLVGQFLARFRRQLLVMLDGRMALVGRQRVGALEVLARRNRVAPESCARKGPCARGIAACLLARGSDNAPRSPATCACACRRGCSSRS